MITGPFFIFFASQSLHNRFFFIKKSGDVNDEGNFSFFILLHKRAKPLLPLTLSLTSARELKPYTPPLPSPSTHLSAHTSHTTHRARTQNPFLLPPIRVRGEYRFSSLMKQKIKAKNCAVFCFAGKRKIFFFYEVIMGKKSKTAQ